MGVPSLVVHTGEFAVDSLAPVRFGVPEARLQMRVASLSPVQFGTPRLKGQEMRPESLVPARFGTPEARFGMPPGEVTCRPRACARWLSAAHRCRPFFKSAPLPA
jgi:hypothetical protein